MDDEVRHNIRGLVGLGGALGVLAGVFLGIPFFLLLTLSALHTGQYGFAALWLLALWGIGYGVYSLFHPPAPSGPPRTNNGGSL